MADYWKTTTFPLKDRVSFLLKNATLSYVKFSFDSNDGETNILYAHKLILANASPVFKQMFYGDLAENTETAIKIEEFDSETFYIMLKYIYTDAVDLGTYEKAINVYGIAHKYLLNAFKNYCICFINETLDATNVLKIYAFAKFFEEETLMEAALNVIRKKTFLVIQSPDFLEIDMDMLMLIMDQKNLQANDLELFNALDKLAAHHTLSYKQIREAIKKINFLDMRAAQFSSGPVFSKLLSARESANILACLVEPSNIKARYPKCLSKIVGRWN